MQNTNSPLTLNKNKLKKYSNFHSFEFTLLIFLFFLTFFQRIQIPLSQFELFLIIPFVYFILTIYLISNLKVSIDKSTLILIITFSVLSILSINNSESKSFFYFIILYIPFLFNIKSNYCRIEKIIDYYQTIILSIGLVSTVLFTLQFYGFTQPDILGQLGKFSKEFNVTNFFPGSDTIFKSYGIFFLEPSFYSKALAFAIILEVLIKKRPLFLTVFFISLLTSVSGTGIAMLLFFFSLVFISTRPIKKIVFWKYLVFSIIILTSVYFSGLLDPIISRLNEFDNEGGSAYIRFIAPYQALLYYLDTASIKELLTGYGAGIIDNLDGEYVFFVEEGHPTAYATTIVKVILEYGVLGFFIYLWFLLQSIGNTKGMVKLVGLTLLFNHLFLTGAFLQVSTLYLLLFFKLLTNNIKHDKGIIYNP